jgi:hypothetical protein
MHVLVNPLDKEKPMTASFPLEQVAQLSTIAQSILVITSLAFIWFQLRQSAELTKAANAQALVEHFTNFNALLMQNPEVARLWYQKGKQLQKEED